jgi:hypothetical protein
MKQDRQGLEGSKPSRGWPNPEGGTKRVGQTREQWTFEPWCAVGSKSPREVSASLRQAGYSSPVKALNGGETRREGVPGFWMNPAQPAEVKPQSRGNGLTA